MTENELAAIRNIVREEINEAIGHAACAALAAYMDFRKDQKMIERQPSVEALLLQAMNQLSRPQNTDGGKK